MWTTLRTGLANPGRANSGLPALVLLLVTVLVTWPTAAQLGVAVPGHPMSDVADHLQGSWWFTQELLAGRLPLETRVTHMPPGGALWYVDPIGALLTLPLLGLGPLAAFSLAVMMQVWGGLFAAFLLARDEGADRAGAVVGALVYGASAYVVSLLYIGTTEYLNLAALPLFWMGARRSLRAERTPWGTVGLTALMGAWAAIGASYHGAFVVLLLGILLVTGEGRLAARLLRLGSIGVGLVVLAAPVLGLAWSTLHAPDAVIRADTAPGWSFARLPALDLLTLIRPGDYYFPDLRPQGNLGIIHVNYLGLLALGAAGLTLWRTRARRPALALGLAILIAAGPVLCVAGVLPMVAGRTVPLPAAILYLVPPFSMIHHPYRLVVLPLVLMVPLVARAVTGWRAALLGAGMLAEILLLSPAVFPIPTMTVSLTPTWEAVPEGGVWELPPEAKLGNRAYIARQVLHERVIPYGVNQLLPPAWRDNHFVRGVMGCLQMQRRGVSRDGGPPAPRWPPADPAQVAVDRQVWLDSGYSTILLHLPDVTGTERRCLEAQLGPGVVVGEEEVWVVRGGVTAE